MSLAVGVRRVSVVGGLGIHPADRLSAAARRLIAYLAVRGPRSLRTLTGMQLWPEVAEDRARANLRRALWQLPGGWVDVNGPDLVLTADVDLVAARQVADRAIAGELIAPGDLKLLVRDVLPGWYEDWLVDEQQQFHLQRVQALEAVCRRGTADGDLCTATRAGLAAVMAEPLRESAVRVLVAAHLREGNRAEAVRRYDVYVALLDAELGAVPGADLQALLSPIR